MGTDHICKDRHIARSGAPYWKCKSDVQEMPYEGWYMDDGGMHFRVNYCPYCGEKLEALGQAERDAKAQALLDNYAEVKAAVDKWVGDMMRALAEYTDQQILEPPDVKIEANQRELGQLAWAIESILNSRVITGRARNELRELIDKLYWDKVQ